MRAVASEVDPSRANVWSRRGPRSARVRKSRLRELALEALEARELLSTVPLPIQDPLNGRQSLFTPPDASGSVGSVSVAVDPANPSRMVAVWQRNDAANPRPAAGGTTTTVPVFVQAAYSTDGGAHWSPVNSTLGSQTPDFTVTTAPIPYFANVTNPSVAFDAHDNFYILDMAHKADMTAGVVELHRFSMAGGSPGASPAGGTVNLYSWNTSASPTPSYPVFQPTLAVDGNRSSGFGAQNDPNASFVTPEGVFGAVYVAWATEAVASGNNQQDSYIQIRASADGGDTFTGGLNIGGGGRVAGQRIVAAPKLTVSQGTTSGSVAPGQLTAVWDDVGIGAFGSPQPYDAIMVGAATFDGTALSVASGQRQIARTYTRGAVNTTAANTPFPNAASTLVSPVGIGPAPAIGSDNTLGAFSPYGGRLYVAYADIATDANGNVATPVDNTNIYLLTSSDGGVNWTSQGQVNDDDAQTDGFSEAEQRANSGRPQFLPSVAVDPATGSVAVSYYDARNDAARARVATYVNVSIDGGASFSPGAYFNDSKTAVDAITDQTVNLGPIPSNQSSGNTKSRDATFGYGSGQGLAFSNGVLVGAWADNRNGGTDGNYGWTASARRLLTAAGPRVVSSTMGVVGEPGDSVNNDPDPVTGAPRASAFLIGFDRRIALGSLTTANVTITYTSPTGVTSTIAPTGVSAQDANALGATLWLVSFPPDARVGTYSYKITPNTANGPLTQISHVDMSGTMVTGVWMDQNANATTAEAVGDVYAVPTTGDTLPLIVPGPHVRSIAVPGGSAVNGVVTVPDAPVTSVSVTFDRAMDPNSLLTSAGNNVVVRMMGPAGPINGPFTVTQGANARTYVISFPAQRLSGTYTLTLAATVKDSAGNLIDSNLNAGLYVLRGADPGAQVTPKTYSGSAAALPAAPGAGSPSKTDATLVVPATDNYVVQGVSVMLDITHPVDQDLRVTLVGPDGVVVNGTIVSGTRTLLFDGVGGSGPAGNFTNTTLDDTATPANPITLAAAPYTGTFNPQQSLANAFVNGSFRANGIWHLVIENSDTADAGTLNSWSITLLSKQPGTGLGEPVGDQATVGFRVFNTKASTLSTTQQWTSIGPSPIVTSHPSDETAYKSGRVGALAVDPSDPSGNTVYAGGASGGVWKTSNFMTADPAGPTWIPLTDFGPNSQINVGTITVVPRKNAQGDLDPTKSIVFVGLGDPDTKKAGTGFLRSTDGGATFQAITGTAPGDTTFSNNATYVWKFAVDPRPNPANGKTIVFAAVGGSAASAGLWRSLDGGDTWTRLRSGQATDVVLDPISGTGITGGNLQVVYAAFPGDGVYSSPNQGQNWYRMLGTLGNPLIQDRDTGQVEVAGSPAAPTGTGDGHILLAKPALTPGTTDPNKPALQDALYEGWLYALVGTGGATDGLYLTKDFGQNWTKIALPVSSNGFGSFPSNDAGKAGIDPAGGASAYNLSLAIDPTDANVVYVGGGGSGVRPGLLRVDVSALTDAHSFVPHSDNLNDGGTLTVNSTGPLSLNYDQTQPSYLRDPQTGNWYAASYLNLIRDPANPFNVNATVRTLNVTQFNNTGAGAKLFTYLSNNTQVEGHETAFDFAASFHRLVAFTDPATGRARLIFGTDEGVFTGVDDDGRFVSGVPTAAGSTGPLGNRNGNLALTQFYYGAVQPSTHSTATGGSMPVLFYGGVVTQGAPASGDLLGSGSTSWTSPVAYDANAFGTPASYNVATDPTGSGTVYRFVPFNLQGTNFFQVQTNGSGAFISRTFGLTTGPGDTQWNGSTYNGGLTTFGNFAVNRISGSQIVIVSNNGTVYRTEDRGQNWYVIGNLADGSYAPAVAFGAPDPSVSNGSTNLDNIIYAGTLSGHVYVTTTGGGGAGNAWTDISAGLDGSTVQRIVTNPNGPSHEAFAITLRGVYRNRDTLAAGSTWQNITGNLTAANFPKLTGLTSLQVDWRYQIPDSAANPAGPSHPVLYVSGDVGVYRSLDAGATWTLFPTNDPNWDSTNLNGDVLSQSGGFLPDTRVSDLDLATGNVNPSNGRSTWQTGDPNLLVASTWGRGQFMINLAPWVVPNAVANQPTWIGLDPTVPGNLAGTTYTGGVQYTTSSTPTVRAFSQVSGFGNTVTVSMYDLTNPATPVLLGTGVTDATGKVSIKNTLHPFAANGVYTVGLQAVDQSGAQGNMAKFTFVVDTPPPAPATLELNPVADTGTSDSDRYTNYNNSNDNAPLFDVSGVVPGGTVYLLRAERVNGVVGAYEVVGMATDATGLGGSLQVADVNGGRGAIADNPLNDPIDTAPPQPNDYVYSAYQVDVLNVQGVNFAPPRHVIIDTDAPKLPTNLRLVSTPANDTGPSSTDKYTRTNTNLEFQVDDIEPNATVELFRSDWDPVAGSYKAPVLVGTTVYAVPTGPKNTVTVADATTIPDTPLGSPGNTPPPSGNPYLYSVDQLDLAGNKSRQTGFGNQGAIVIDGTDSDQHGDVSGGVNQAGWSYMQKVLELIAPNVTNSQRVIVALGADPTDQTLSAEAAESINSAFTLGSLPGQGWSIVYVDGAADIDDYLSGRVANAYTRTNQPVPGGITIGKTGILYITTSNQASGDLTSQELGVVNTHGQDISDYVNDGGGLFAQAESPSFGGGGEQPWGWLTNIFPGIVASELTGFAGPYDIQITAAGQQAFPGLTVADLSTGPWHNYFSGDLGALTTAVTDLDGPASDPNSVRRSIILTSTAVVLTQSQVIVDTVAPDTPSLTLDPSSVTGTLDGHDYTNHNNDPSPGNAPAFNVGAVEPNATVNLYRTLLVNGSPSGAPELVGTVVAGALGGPVTVADTNDANGHAPIPDGDYRYTVEQVDLAGNSLGAGSPLDVTVDTGPPGPPLPFRLDPAFDTGVANDNVTQNNNGNPYPAPRFDTYGIEVNATVRLYRQVVVNGVPTGTPLLVNTVANASPAGPNAEVTIDDLNAGNGTIPDGVYYYYATQTDVADNTSTVGNGINVTIDSTPPQPSPFAAPDLEAASDTGQFNADNVTQNNNGVSNPNSPTPYPAPVFDAGTVALPVEPGATVELLRAPADPVTGQPTGSPVVVNTLTFTTGGVVPIADVNGNDTTIPDGTYAYYIRLTDQAGNVGAISPFLTVVINTATPPLPQPFRLNAGSDTGVSSSDGITQVVKYAHPVFDTSGVLRGATLKLYRAPADPVTGAPTGAAVLVNTVPNVQPGGATQISDPTNAIADGKYVYSIQQVDLSGNVGPVGGAIVVEYDTAQPASATKAPVLNQASWTASTNPLNPVQTSSQHPIFDVTVNLSGFDVNSKLTLVRDGKAVAPIVVPALVPDNPANYNIPAGAQTLSIQDPGDYVVGTSNPPQYTPVPYGTHTYQVYVTDLAGNTSVLSAPVQVTIATDPPGSLALDDASDSGVKGDRVTNVSNPTFDVSGVVANGTLKLLRGGLTVATIATGAGGTLTITDPGPLTNGQYSYTAQQTDSGGKTSPPGPPLLITVDTTPPIAPSQFKLDPTAANDTGLLGDGITANPSPTFDASGVVPGSTVNLYRDNVLVATLPSVLVGGTVQIVDPGDLVAGSNPPQYTPVPNGTHTYTVQQVSVAGNPSPNSAPLSVTIDATVPDAPAPFTLDPASHRGSSDPNTTSVVNPTFDVGVVAGAGALVKGAKLQLYRYNGAFSGPLPTTLQSPWQLVTTVGGLAGGTATIQDPGPLANGVYTYAVVQTNIAGTTSPPSAPLTLTINTTPPAIPTVPRLSLTPASDSGLPGDGVTSKRVVTIAGIADPFVTVKLYDVTGGAIGSGHEKYIGSAAADANGDFTVGVPLALTNGAYKFAATATDYQNPPHTSGATNPPFLVNVVTVAGDYTGAGKAGPQIFRRTNPQLIQWFANGNSQLASVNFGSGRLDVPLQGDFFGAGTDQPAVFRASTAEWFVLNPHANYSGQLLAKFGADTDLPVPGNYFGNNISYPAVYRPSTGAWYALTPGSNGQLLGGGTLLGTVGGQAGDVPVPADYGHVGKDQMAVYRPSTHTWIIGTPTGPVQIVFGGANDIPVPGVYDAPTATRAAEPAVWRASTGQFFVLGPTGGRVYQFAPGDIPVPADWDGIGLTEPAVYRPTTNQFLVYGPNDDPSLPPRTLTAFGGPNPPNFDVPALAPYAFRALNAPGGTITAFSAPAPGTGLGTAVATAAVAPVSAALVTAQAPAVPAPTTPAPAKPTPPVAPAATADRGRPNQTATATTQTVPARLGLFGDRSLVSLTLGRKRSPWSPFNVP